MPTSTAILNRACRITGLRSSGAERELALEALQDAYRRATIDAETFPSSVTYTIPVGQDTYDLATVAGEPVIRLLHVALTDHWRDLTQISHQELLDRKASEFMVGEPMYYAAVGFDRLALYPEPPAGMDVTVWYMPDTPTLQEDTATLIAGEEYVPSQIPAHFHFAVLLPGVVLELLDKDQRATESQTWQARYERGITRLQEHMGQMGGDANRAYVRRVNQARRRQDGWI